MSPRNPADPASAPAAPTSDAGEKRAGWAELFFDLVFVFAVTEISTLLRADPSWAGLGRALVLFVPIYWAWVGTSIHTNTQDVNNSTDRLGIFSLALCGLFMALAAPGAYTDRAVLFGAAYLALRVVLAALVWRAHRMVLAPFLIQVVLTGPLVLAGGFLPNPARVWTWALAALLDLATPALARRALSQATFDPGHLPERFALFVIIALGESIVAIGIPAAATARLDATHVAAVGASFAFTTALWWLYFGHTAEAVPTALATAPIPTDVVRQVLSYAHLALLAGIIATATALTTVVIHPSQVLDPTSRRLLFGGCALYLTAMSYVHKRTRRRWSPSHLIAAATSIAMIPATSQLPALAALAALVATLTVLNILKGPAIVRAGWDGDGHESLRTVSR